MSGPSPGSNHVVLISSSANLFGSDRAALDLAVDLVATGHRVTLIVPEAGPLQKLAADHGISIVQIPLTILRRRSRAGWLRFTVGTPRRLLRFARCIKRLDPDVVHSNTSHVLDGGLTCWLLRVPHVWHFRELHTDAKRIAAVITVFALATSRRVICISNAVAEFHGEQVPRVLASRAAARIVVVPDGIDVEHFAQVPPSVEVDTPHDRAVVLAYGRMARWKGYDVLIEAAGLAVEMGAPVQLVIAGGPATDDDAEYLRELQQMALERGVEAEFVGTHSDVRPLLSRADIAVLPSRRPEPFGRVVLEAMAAGLPVIATTPGGPAEVIDDGSTGFLVRCGQADPLARALYHLATSPGERRRIGAAGQAAVRARFSSQRTSRLVAEIYDGLGA